MSSYTPEQQAAAVSFQQDIKASRELELKTDQNRRLELPASAYALNGGQVSQQSFLTSQSYFPALPFPLGVSYTWSHWTFPSLLRTSRFHIFSKIWLHFRLNIFDFLVIKIILVTDDY